MTAEVDDLTAEQRRADADVDEVDHAVGRAQTVDRVPHRAGADAGDAAGDAAVVADARAIRHAQRRDPRWRHGVLAMEPSFWQQRWREGRVGFHQDRVTPLLEDHWNAIGVPAGGCVFVPLAGKSLDMLWLAARGYRVLGVELSPIAVEQFFAEHQLLPTRRESRYGIHYVAGEIELICGDAFALDAEILAPCAGVYDRAALIALPADMRQRYVDQVYARLPTGCRGLLVTMEYPPHQKDGPPFGVDEDEVRRLYAPDWAVESLARSDILASQPGFIAEGVTALHAAAYRLWRR